ncbi:MAG TPA: fibronectin type III domain-containing protein [Desulfuromonadaceae bacterium]|nr:fibronectin type III domain-containing protein [Desulfuromonadaceae bacterium]
MNRFITFVRQLFTILAPLGLTACSALHSSRPANDDVAFASPDHVTAVYTNGDVIVHWQNHARADGGNWVEFSTPGSEYIKLQVSLNDRPVDTFLHPRVAPATEFIYHVQPFFGQATEPVKVVTGETPEKATSLEDGPIAGMTNRTTSPKVSIRTMQTFSEATPRDLTATLPEPTVVDLCWSDTVSDESGWLVEWKPSATDLFIVCALLPADTTSFRKTQLPAQTTSWFRVRPYFDAKPSETASVLTPPELISPAPIR